MKYNDQMPKITPTIFENDTELGRAAAEFILSGIQAAQMAGETYVLGCPGGRSPRSTYRALAGLIARDQVSIKHLVIAMMDEYVIGTDPTNFVNVGSDSHFSCMRFAFLEIRDLLNAGLSPESQQPIEQVLIPDAQNPQNYEDLLQKIGVDCFLLASGATDGHVAFNCRGTDRNATTRVAALSDETRLDNLQTFPDFAALSEVPKFGVTVGPGTIAAISKSAIALLQGEHKALAFRRISNVDRYDPDWPASIITECNFPQIFADATATGSI